MPITGTIAPSVISPPPTIYPYENLQQGCRIIDGTVHMLDDGEDRWVYITEGNILYLTEDSEVIIYP